MRKFAFVILDSSDKIVDRLNLDYVDGISGLGFQLKLGKIETDIEDYITKIVQTKQSLGLTVHHLRGYSAGEYLKQWLAKNINNCLCLEYDNTQKTYYIEGVVTDCGETELNEYKVLEQKLKFQPVTPFFEKIDNDVTIKYSSTGKCYPYRYPYCYGRNKIENNEIYNSYISDIPIIVTINGTISNPVISLLDENEVVYNTVKFNDVDLLAGEKIIINSAQKKIYFDDGSGDLVDYYYKLDGAYDSFLRAKPLIKSKISINLEAGDTGSLIGSRRQYKL